MFKWKPVVVGLASLLLAGCVTVKAPNPLAPDPSCTIYANLGVDVATTTAIIPKYIKNPCAAQNIIVTVAEGAYALDAYQIDDFKKWIGMAKAYMGTGIDFGTAKMFIGAEIGKVNRKLGMMYFMLSDLLVVLPDGALLQPDDVRLVNASLDDVVKRVEGMSRIMGYNVPASAPR